MAKKGRSVEPINLSDLIRFTDSQKRATYSALNSRYTLFGGIRGPGKSFWCRWYCVLFLLSLSDIGIHGARGSVCTMHYPELKELHINKFLTEVPEWFGEYHASDKEYHFAQRYGGHVLAFRNLDDPKRKKGTENAIIAVDELTEIPSRRSPICADLSGGRESRVRNSSPLQIRTGNTRIGFVRSSLKNVRSCRTMTSDNSLSFRPRSEITHTFRNHIMTISKEFPNLFAPRGQKVIGTRIGSIEIGRSSPRRT